ncbi:MAG: PEP-CTERM sorting domain-containing protein [Verrucomicrobiae bacterium]|nr:PEP-CTERM sorting domain-containing protein [Verrucomicrobiae bacterium]
MKNRLHVLFAFGLIIAVSGVTQAQTNFYSDDFNRATINGGTYTYTTNASAGDGAVSLDGTKVTLSNDGSGAANANGRVFFSTPASGFSSGFNTQLNANPSTLQWTFNVKYDRTTEPSGFNSGNYGMAVVLGATSSDFMTANGYALVFGNSGTPDPFRLVTFTSGLDLNSQLTNVVSATTAPFSDPQTGGVLTNHYSFRVTYNPLDSSWLVYGRDDGTAAFADPIAGVTTLLASGSINTDYTSSSLTHLGVLWNYGTTANQTMQFDNYSLMAIPEPSTYALMLAGATLMLGVCLRRRRSGLLR